MRPSPDWGLQRPGRPQPPRKGRRPLPHPPCLRRVRFAGRATGGPGRPRLGCRESHRRTPPRPERGERAGGEGRG
eukprot:scaffold9039_cov115-Isochrysis_galbana.AAC.3